MTRRRGSRRCVTRSGSGAALAIAALTVVTCAGCATDRYPDGTGHFESRTWSSAWSQFGSHGSQWIAPTALVVATPIVWAFDDEISESSVAEHTFNSNTAYGNQVLGGLVGIPLVFGGIEAIGGDTRDLEVAAESLAVTVGTTYLLKLVVDKTRPDESAEDSFPSSHASLAFAGATLIARGVEDHYGHWLGYLAYIPAAYVGVTRLEGEKHFLADITFGAALGMLVTNLVYDAHFGEEGAGIFGSDNARLSFGPSPDARGFAVGVSWSF